MWADNSVGVLVGVVLGGAVAWLGVRQLRLSATRAAVPPTLHSEAASVQALLDQKVKDAPRLFAEARRLEAIRAQMMCCCCDEPTAIVCDACGKLCCVGHLGSHGCGVAGEPLVR